MKSVLIAGGGIAGLSAAWHVQKLAEARGETLNLTLLEASNRVGGKVQTTRKDGFVMEHGPDSFITQKPQALALAKELGLEQELIPCNQSMQHVFIAMENALHPLPKGFRLLAPTRIWEFLRSDLFSLRGKLRALSEPFIPRKEDGQEESIAAFVERRLGKEILDRAAGPILSGIYNGEPDQLSIQATFPMLPALEKKYGSLVRGFRKAAKSAPANPPPMFMSFKNGMQTLTDKLEAKLTDHIQVNQSIESLEQTDTGWKIRTHDTLYEADQVILALPPAAAHEVLSPLLEEKGQNHLSHIHCRTSLAISLGFRKETLTTPSALDGFGFVTHQRKNRTLTACTWSSVKFHPHRAPEDHDLVRIFLAGDDLSGELVNDDAFWTNRALEEISPWMQWNEPPVTSQVTRWPTSNPQYTLGHLSRMKELQTSVNAHPGLHLIGGAYGGVGLPDCIAQGERAAQACFAR